MQFSETSTKCSRNEPNPPRSCTWFAWQREIAHFIYVSAISKDKRFEVLKQPASIGWMDFGMLSVMWIPCWNPIWRQRKILMYALTWKLSLTTVVRFGTIAFSINKCGKLDCSICLPLRLPSEIFGTLSFLPDPVPDDDHHYKKFDDLYGTSTSEEHRPSLKDSKGNQSHWHAFQPGWSDCC